MSGPGQGNLAHSPKNDTRFDQLLELSDELGKQAANGNDSQVRHLLSVAQAAMDGVIDNTVNKHGLNKDDATVICDRYWSARNKHTKFDPKAGNQRKTISCVRQIITLGGWTKGGHTEPLAMINQAMTIYGNMRKTPQMQKRLKDAANFLVDIARRMKKSDRVLTQQELQDLALKSTPDVQTVADVLDHVRGTLTKLKNGKHPAGVCATSNIEAAISCLNTELTAISQGNSQ